MEWWLLRLTVKILAFLRLTVNFFSLRLTEIFKKIISILKGLKLIPIVVKHIYGLRTILGQDTSLQNNITVSTRDGKRQIGAGILFTDNTFTPNGLANEQSLVPSLVRRARNEKKKHWRAEKWPREKVGTRRARLQTVDIFQFSRLMTKLWAVLRLTVNPVETLFCCSLECCVCASRV